MFKPYTFTIIANNKSYENDLERGENHLNSALINYFIESITSNRKVWILQDLAGSLFFDELGGHKFCPLYIDSQQAKNLVLLSSTYSHLLPKAISFEELLDTIQPTLISKKYSVSINWIGEELIIIEANSFQKSIFIELQQSQSYACPCCGYYTLELKPPGTYDICSICFWEDDMVQYNDPDYEGGANTLSLREYQKHFVLTGSGNRKPDRFDNRASNWKPLK